jgi:hypothetical protein
VRERVLERIVAGANIGEKYSKVFSLICYRILKKDE